MCGKRFVLFFLVLFLGPLSLWAQSSQSPTTQESSSSTTSPQPEPAIATPSSPSTSPESLPLEFWTTWVALGQGLQQQIGQQQEQSQTQVSSETLLQNEKQTTDSAAQNSQAASNALSQTSTAITSAISSSEVISAQIVQGTTAAEKTDSKIGEAQVDAKGLELQLGVWKGLGVSFGIGFVALGVDKLGQVLKIWK